MPAKPRLHAAPATFVSLALILALVVLALVVFTGAEAAGQGQPQCGDKITADTTLHKDLVDCPNHGIVIGADGITLDLNGHTIDGDATSAAGCNPRREFCDFGVLNRGHDGVTVMHGSVREFTIGAWVGNARHNRLLDLSSSSNEGGLGFFRSHRSLVRNSSASGNSGQGMFLIGGSHHVRIRHNSLRNNGGTDVPGLTMSDSTHNLIKGNLISGSRHVGMELFPGADGNRVRGNRLVRDGLGISVLNGDRNVIARNRIAHIRENFIGIELSPHADHNVIARNSIRDTKGDGIALGLHDRTLVGNVVRRNHIRRAGGNGVAVSPGVKHTLLRRNRASHSKDDGFDIEAPTTKLTQNRAVRNGDLGIEAVRGVIDGGGNIARHNGDPRQCTHIACN